MGLLQLKKKFGFIIEETKANIDYLNSLVLQRSIVYCISLKDVDFSNQRRKFIPRAQFDRPEPFSGNIISSRTTHQTANDFVRNLMR